MQPLEQIQKYLDDNEPLMPSEVAILFYEMRDLHRAEGLELVAENERLKARRTKWHLINLSDATATLVAVLGIAFGVVALAAVFQFAPDNATAVGLIEDHATVVLKYSDKLEHRIRRSECRSRLPLIEVSVAELKLACTTGE